MTKEYGLPCPVAKTLDIIGDRWTLLIIRDLLSLGPRKYVELSQSLQGIAPNVFSDRLKLLEAQWHHRARVLRRASSARAVPADAPRRRPTHRYARPPAMGQPSPLRWRRRRPCVLRPRAQARNVCEQCGEPVRPSDRRIDYRKREAARAVGMTPVAASADVHPRPIAALGTPATPHAARFGECGGREPSIACRHSISISVQPSREPLLTLRDALLLTHPGPACTMLVTMKNIVTEDRRHVPCRRIPSRRHPGRSRRGPHTYPLRARCPRRYSHAPMPPPRPIRSAPRSSAFVRCCARAYRRDARADRTTG